MRTLLALLLLTLLVGCAAPTPPAPTASAAPAAPTDQAAAPVGAAPTVFLPTVSGEGLWQPAPGTTWQWQLSTVPIDTSVDAEMFDIDYESDPATVAALHAQGRSVVCYLNVGAWEEWRPDADQFPAEVIGNDYEGWPGEKWLDIRRIDLLGPLMRARLDQCAASGFDGIEPDNMNGYQNDTGFPLTYADQLAYNLWLANEAHARGLSIGLKNTPEQVGDLLPHYDWALTESCFVQGWCEMMLPFIEEGKAVFAAEYTESGITLDEFCPQARDLRISAILKHVALDAYIEMCPD